MVVTFQTINKIAFPVFVLGSDNWDIQDGLVYLNGLILDDRNIKASTLGTVSYTHLTLPTNREV